MLASTASLSDLTCVKIINILLCHNTAEYLVCFIAKTGIFLTQIQYCTSIHVCFSFICVNQSRYNVMLLLLAYYVVLLFHVP